MMDARKQNATKQEEPVLSETCDMTKTRKQSQVTVKAHKAARDSPEEGARQVAAVGAVRVELTTCDFMDIDASHGW